MHAAWWLNVGGDLEKLTAIVCIKQTTMDAYIVHINPFICWKSLTKFILGASDTTTLCTQLFKVLYISSIFSNGSFGKRHTDGIASIWKLTSDVIIYMDQSQSTQRAYNWISRVMRIWWQHYPFNSIIGFKKRWCEGKEKSATWALTCDAHFYFFVSALLVYIDRHFNCATTSLNMIICVHNWRNWNWLRQLRKNVKYGQIY